MKKALLGLIAILFLAPNLVSAACYAPIPPAECVPPDSMMGRYSGSYVAARAAYESCLADEEEYHAQAAAYNQCVARENAGPQVSCEDTAPVNGTAKMAGSSCKITCNEGFYLTKDQRCVVQTVRTPEPVVTPVVEPVVEPAPIPVIAPVPVSKPSIIEAAKGVQLFAPKKEEVSPAKTEGEATTTPPPLPAKKPWWHYLNPFNWF